MKSYAIILAFLLEALTVLAMSSPSPATPTCDQSLLNKIDKFWAGAGTPQNLLKLLETSGDYVVVDTKIDILNGDSKCVYVNGSASKPVLQFTFVPKYNNETVASLVYDDAKEDNGFLSTKKWKQRMYNILVSNNVLAAYSCSTEEGQNGAPVGFIAVNPKSWSDSCTQTTLQNTRGLMNMLGFTFRYKYGKECFK